MPATGVLYNQLNIQQLILPAVLIRSPTGGKLLQCNIREVQDLNK
jgi:hypothetical protein